jgi:uncharacterized protein (UPF0335 family)
VSDWILNPEWEHAQFVSISELKECQNKLKFANERIKRLEEENDALRADLLLWDKAGIGFTTEDKP